MSIVIAAYNQAVWLRHAIASVRAQSFGDWELVVVDDGSTDGTRDLVSGHAGDHRIRYIHQTHAERSAARNRGIAASSAPLVAFLDADDLWRPDKLAKQMTALEAAPAAGLCYTPARFVDAAGDPLPIRKPPRTISGDVFPRLMRGNVIILASVLVRRPCLDEVGGFDTMLPGYGCEDWDLWLRFARRWPFAVVDEELTLYRRHGANTAWRQVLASALAVVDKWYADPETARRVGLPREAVRALHYWTNAAGIAMERRSAAMPLVAAALREFPAAALSRSALATLATLVLPYAVVRTMRRLST